MKKDQCCLLRQQQSGRAREGRRGECVEKEKKMVRVDRGHAKLEDAEGGGKQIAGNREVLRLRSKRGKRETGREVNKVNFLGSKKVEGAGGIS